MSVARPRPTLEEFLKFPELEPPLEFEAGRVAQKVSPSPAHGRLQLWLGSRIEGFGEPERYLSAFSETRVTFLGTPRSYVPDIIAYRRDRVPRKPNGEIADVFETPPDLVVEILSPGQSVAALSRRCRWDVEQGVVVVLLVDPARRTVRLFRAGGYVVVLRGAARIDLDELMPGLDLTVQEIFDALRP